MPRRNDLEQKALQFIMNTGYEGVLQSELWRKLGGSSREGSRIALKLENKGLIIREKELFGGRWTYRLYPKRRPVSINSIIDCPCLMCPNDSRCGAWGTISPYECERLTEWILSLHEAKLTLLVKVNIAKSLGQGKAERLLLPQVKGRKVQVKSSIQAS